ncbi:MAG: hypothetical protein AAF694_02125 [Bacteroidota bacterium]
MFTLIKRVFILTLVLLFLFIPIGYFAIKSFKESDAFKFSQAFIKGNPKVNSQLGGLRKLGWIVGGTLEKEGDVEKSATFRVAVYGKNGDKLFANIQLTRFEESWRVDTFYLDRGRNTFYLTNQKAWLANPRPSLFPYTLKKIRVEALHPVVKILTGRRTLILPISGAIM